MFRSQLASQSFYHSHIHAFMMLLATTAVSPQPSPLLLNPSTSMVNAPSPSTSSSRHSPRRPAMYTSNSVRSSFGAEGVNGTPLDFSDPPEVVQARARAAAETEQLELSNRNHRDSSSATGPRPSSIRLPTYSPTGYPFPWVLSRPATPDLNSSEPTSPSELLRSQLGDLNTQTSTWSSSSSSSGGSGSNGPASFYSEAGSSAAGFRDRETAMQLDARGGDPSWYSPALASGSTSGGSGYNSSPFFGAPVNQRSPLVVSTGESSPALASTSPEDAWKLGKTTHWPSQVVSSPVPQPPTHPPTPVEDIVSRSKDAGCTPGATAPLPFVSISSTSTSSSSSPSLEKPKPDSSPPSARNSTASSKAASVALKRARLGLSLSLSGLNASSSNGGRPSGTSSSTSSSANTATPPAMQQQMQLHDKGRGNLQITGNDGGEEGSSTAVSAAALSQALAAAIDTRPIMSSPLREG